MPETGVKVAIRRAEPRDFPALLGMVAALTRHHDDVPRVTLADLERDIPGGCPWFQVLMAETEDGLAGYAATLPLARLGYGERGLDLHHLYVAEALRGRGIGTALMRGVEALARDLRCSYLVIGTHADNTQAHGFYQSLGYDRMSNIAVRFTRGLV